MKSDKYTPVPATKAEIKFIDDALDAFNEEILGHMNDHSLSFVIKEENVILAGLEAVIYWKVLFVRNLFVGALYRGKGLGQLLLHTAEQEALKEGCTLAHLDTFDFQAKDFYFKQGYKLFGTLNACPTKGHCRYYLEKTLG